ncbi:hypothetical protein [Desulfatitalea alkaliphila]|uniref:Uncharacterized protein n=1 Tax=Desulfatitalea alkaliphila TaxID=2929485 RepID=A0AA41R7U3_9BACT|nr:hypothetical protein [Desulfatitalea alkaliphila]MCJ8503178.1 hypothetical protein [Desulfatitalea alkaliphila]
MGKIINICCCAIFMVLWLLYFLSMEVPNWKTSRYLGGMAILFYLLPIIIFAIIKFSKYALILWSALMFFSIIIFINHLHGYLLYNHVAPPNLILAYIIVSMPAYFGAAGYTAIIMCVFKMGSIYDYQDPSEGFKELIGLSIYTMMPSFAAMLATFSAKPMVVHVVNRNFALNVGYEYIISAFIVALIYFVYETLIISDESINYYAKPFKRISNYTIPMVKRYCIIGLPAFALISFALELFRRANWLIWGQSMILFYVGAYLMFKFGKVLFVPLPTSGIRPNNLYPYLPRMRSKKKIFTMIFFVGLYGAVFHILFW